MIEFLKSANIWEMIRLCEDSGISCEWYIFGSVAAGESSPSDIDVLLISDHDKDLDRARDVIKDYLLLAPIHLIAMTNQEESVLSFIESVSAVNVRVLSS